MDDIDDIEQLIAETDAAAEQAQAPAEVSEAAETDEPEPAADQISKVDIPAEPGIANSPVGETDSAPRKGIFAFLANLIFGKDAPEDENELKARQAEASGISPEDQAILDELEGKKAAEEKDAKKAAKKAAAEAKKKAKQEAAEAKKKEKAAKKAAKPPKPKKEKKPKEPKKPVNKRPIIVVAVFTASVFIFVNLLSSAATYTADVSRATSLYNAGQYVEAYEELAGSSAHKGDQDFYDGAKMLAILQQSIFRHDTDVAAGRNAEALDILVRAIGTYKTNFDRADELGILSQYTNLELQIESLLEEYGVTYDQALELYAMTDRDEYTVAILQLVAE